MPRLVMKAVVKSSANYFLAAMLFVGVCCERAGAQGFPEPKPGKAQELFKHDVGEWDCEIKMYIQGPDGDPVEYKGTEKNELVCGGLFLKSEFHAEMGESDFEGHSLMGFNPKTKKYEGTWVDSFTIAPTKMVGEYDETKKAFTVLSTVQDPAGQELKQKQVTTYVDANTKKFEIFLVVDAGGQSMDLRLMEMTAKKK